jgi:hypothetical protein
MTESITERQAIRAALTLAAASAHGRTPDAVADLREEASQLIGLCIKDGSAADGLLQWCDDAAALIRRLASDDCLPQQPALNAETAVLRFRLAVVRQPQPAHIMKEPPTKKIHVVVEGGKKKLLDFIASHPNMRTSALVTARAGELSSRSIKRFLKELLVAGAVRRTKLEDGGVAYRAIDSAT